MTPPVNSHRSVVSTEGKQPAFEDPPSPRLEFFVSRENGSLVPLVAADELPKHVQLRGIPRNLSHNQTTGLTRVAHIAPAQAALRVQRSKVFPLGKATAGHQSLEASTSCHGSKDTATSLATNSDKPLPEKGEKIYCTHWLKYGKCSFMQQGCKYKHERPEDEEMQRMTGIKRTTDWKPPREPPSRGVTRDLPANNKSQSVKSKVQILDSTKNGRGHEVRKPENEENAKSDSMETFPTQLRDPKKHAEKGKQKAKESTAAGSAPRKWMVSNSRATIEPDHGDLLDFDPAPKRSTSLSGSSSVASSLLQPLTPISTSISTGREIKRHESGAECRFDDPTVHTRASSINGRAHTQGQQYDGIFPEGNMGDGDANASRPMGSGVTPDDLEKAMHSLLQGLRASEHAPKTYE